MIDTIAYVATAVILGSYAFSAWRPWSKAFHWANTLLWPLILASAVSHKARPSAVITASFGAIGVLGILTPWIRQQRFWRGVRR